MFHLKSLEKLWFSNDFWWNRSSLICVNFETKLDSSYLAALYISIVRIHLWSLNCYLKLSLTVFICSDVKHLNNFASENMKTERWTYFYFFIFFFEIGQISLIIRLNRAKNALELPLALINSKFYLVCLSKLTPVFVQNLHTRMGSRGNHIIFFWPFQP